MDDPAQHPAVIDTPLAAGVRRQQRLDPCPLRIRKPKEIRHRRRLLAEGSESQIGHYGNPDIGSGPQPLPSACKTCSRCRPRLKAVSQSTVVPSVEYDTAAARERTCRVKYDSQGR